MSPGAPGVEEERTELLGSLTTQQQQRTSARVIKKLRLEPQTDKREPTECETPNKIDDKDPLKFPTVKQRMPKALWSADEKSLFFEALNEYGKDFDAITAYICAKMKKKGMSDGNLKTKTQVSHFYYRTWHKLSKHVRFDENVKKVAQELYALINYGELRRKLASVNEKTCARLGEMVRGGSMAVRARGKTLRVRTPMCRALRRLNQIAERACGARVCSRAQVILRARDACAWARVQAAAHNPRTAAALPLRTRLVPFLKALERRWKSSVYKESAVVNGIETKITDEGSKECEEYQEMQTVGDLEDHLQLETDSIIVQEHSLPKKLALHVGPRPGVEVHLPVLSPSEQLSSQKICFSSYLERMGSLRRDKDSGVKIRTPKRQRKDSITDKDKESEKRLKMDDAEMNKLMHIDETAIDGIELMAHFKNNQDDEEKPSTEDEKELKSEETAEEEGDRDIPERDKDILSEREKDSFSEMEDDEKYNKSDTDNESDGRHVKQKERKFKNLKVKFRIRPKKRGGSIYTLVLENNAEEAKSGESKINDSKIEDMKVQESKIQESKEESKVQELRVEEKEEEIKPDIDMDLAIRQIRKGWSVHDAGELTIGDLYLMFGSRSKIELDYWWAEPTPPLPQPTKSHKLETINKPIDREKGNKTPEKGDSSVEDEKEKSDNDIFSPKNTFSQDSNDGMSGDERKSEQLSSPDHKSGSLKLVSKLINRPAAPPPATGFSLLTDRLKRLLALAGNTHVSNPPGIARCNCGHVCSQKKQQKQQPCSPTPVNLSSNMADTSTIFRHPTPIAPRPDPESQRPISNGWMDGLPKWRRGRPRMSDRRVIVQRLLPLLPKLPPPSNLIPVKMVSNTTSAPPRILPKPPPMPPSDNLSYYLMSESNGQFYFHDGDRRIPIRPLSDSNDQEEPKSEDEEDNKDINIVKVETQEANAEQKEQKQSTDAAPKFEQNDIAGFLPTESMSLSPSHLLRDTEGWLEGSVQDFSLSSFLGHLEGRPVDSQLQSLMAESSVDYVAKFADLAAEVTDEPDLTDDLK